MPPAACVRLHDSVDDDEVARIATAAFPDYPLTGAELAAGARRRGARFHRKFVAEAHPGQLAGFGFIEVPDVAAAEGRLRVRVVVDPAWRGHGIGDALYQMLEADAQGRGATELCAEALESQPHSVRFAAEHGFAIYNQRVDNRLRLGGIDTGRIGRGIDMHVDRLFATGIRIATYRQLAQTTTDAPRHFHQLSCELWEDIPFGIRGAHPSFDSFVAEELDNPSFRAEGTFVALDGARWIGVCAQNSSAGCLMTWMTGVIRPWRRHGIAHWLKLHSIVYALDVGAPEIRTFNDTANRGMLALNQALGFVAIDTDLRLKKELC